MPYVITQNCCNDASCIAACPVGCIHPTPDEPGFATAEMLHIDPATCIDCGACADACPVNAIVPSSELTEATLPYLQLNASYYRDRPLLPQWQHRRPRVTTHATEGLRVAIVGAGPAAWYAAKELLAHPGVQVNMFERLPTPWGLVRAGVAPDHPETKAVTEQFTFPRDQQQRFTLHLNVEIGAHLSHEQLTAHHHAVIYAQGAASGRRLGIPGEELANSFAATAFVHWYNGHPDYTDLNPDLSGRRAVIVGNGNVALDIARVLTVDPDLLARTDMADHAVDALRHSAIEEVVLLGRRGPMHAAFTTPELLALTQLPGVDVVLAEGAGALGESTHMKAELLRGISARAPRGGNKRIVFRFLSSPTEITGTTRVQGLQVGRNTLTDGGQGATATGESDHVEAGLVIHAVGHRGTALPGVPFDEASGTIPNERGRVLDTPGGAPLRGVYTAGWIKRGPSGVIGTNRTCAQETVAQVLRDYRDQVLASQVNNQPQLQALVARNRPQAVGARGWDGIDAAERARGQAVGKPRRKFTSTSELLEAARRAPS